MYRSLQLQTSGKRRSRRSVVALSVGGTSRLLFVSDRVSGSLFLCDTGAQWSVVPASREGREFTAFVDHKPLTVAMSKVAEPWSARQQRQLSYISEFTTDIKHVAGKSNLVADCLSRVVIGAVQLGLDYTRMATDQVTDSGVQALKEDSLGLRLEGNWVDKLPCVMLGLRRICSAPRLRWSTGSR